MTQKFNQSGRLALASSLSLCLVWIAIAIGSMLTLQRSDSFSLLQFLRLSGAAFVGGVVVSVTFAVYLAFRHSWRAMAAVISLSVFLGATACFLRYAGV